MTDLFGQPDTPARKATPRRQTERERLEERWQAAADDVPQAMFDLGQARDACAPYDRDWDAADRALRAITSRTGFDPAHKAERSARYTARLHAGHARHPYLQAVKEAERWLDNLQKEMAYCMRRLHPEAQGGRRRRLTLLDE